MALDIFSKWKKSLDKTRKVAFGRIASILGTSEINNDTWDELEAILVQADVGVETTIEIIDKMKAYANQEGITKASDLSEILQSELINRIDAPLNIDLSDHQPTVILVVGVNGSGKTTSIAKLGQLYKQQGKSVLFAASDTFRAAAVEQLEIWANRLNIPIIMGQPNADPGSVAYDAVHSAISKKTDIVLVDTAGRLHTRYNLMEELKKVYRVCGKALPGAPHAVWLVLDATTGQNALHQARSFKEAVNVDGIILSKLDSSAKGGMVFAIQKELEIPILFAGLGEKPEDLQQFDRNNFVESILSN